MTKVLTKECPKWWKGCCVQIGGKCHSRCVDNSLKLCQSHRGKDRSPTSGKQEKAAVSDNHSRPKTSEIPRKFKSHLFAYQFYNYTYNRWAIDIGLLDTFLCNSENCRVQGGTFVQRKLPFHQWIAIPAHIFRDKVDNRSGTTSSGREMGGNRLKSTNNPLPTSLVGKRYRAHACNYDPHRNLC